ncbi:MAG: hypothetical protein LH628_05905 [Microcoleus sp. CAN_BIN18]|nr:hypothetical protein [Microcoleus sp. CAN_BIN18]
MNHVGAACAKRLDAFSPKEGRKKGRMRELIDIRRRLKPRLYKRCPPPRTEEDNVILTAWSSTRLEWVFV